MKEYRDDLSFVISGYEKGEVSFRLLHINIDSLDEGVNDSETQGVPAPSLRRWEGDDKDHFDDSDGNHLDNTETIIMTTLLTITWRKQEQELGREEGSRQG